MLLYHGTTEHAAKQAIRLGLLPREMMKDVPTKGNWQHTISSNSNVVYLTTAYAPYFAIHALDDTDQRIAIIEIESERLLQHEFRPDEDFLEQSTRGGVNPPLGLEGPSI